MRSALASSATESPQASFRSGAIREPTRSDQRPTTIRSAAPQTCMRANRPAATAVDRPRAPCRNSTVNAMMLIWAATISPLPTARRHMRGSRSGWVTSPRLSPSAGGASRRPTAPATAVTRHAPASASSPASVPPTLTIGGRARAAAAPPSGRAVCRIPSANPRSEAENQPMTARPLAAFTLAPAAPATRRRITSAAYPLAKAAPASARLAATRPVARTERSPSRSVRRPHGSSVRTEPRLNAARTTPTSASVSPNSTRSAGARTGMPRNAAE